MKYLILFIMIIPVQLYGNNPSYSVSPAIDFHLVDKEILVLDTVIAKDNNTTILKYRKYQGESKDLSYRDINNVDYTSHSYTLNNHSLLNAETPLSNIKAIAPQGAGLLVRDENGSMLFMFDNPISEVVFIGFKE